METLDKSELMDALNAIGNDIKPSNKPVANSFVLEYEPSADDELLNAAVELGIDLSDPAPAAPGATLVFDGAPADYDPPKEVSMPKDKKKAKKEKMFKADKMVNGFMLQADPIADGKDDPFWMELHVLGKDEFYISGGQEGKLNTEELKSLRKSIKQVLNQEAGSFPEGEDGFEGGKATIKVDAPWVPNDLQVSIAKDLINKKLTKLQEDGASEAENVDSMVKIFTMLFAQMGHTPSITSPNTPNAEAESVSK